AGMVLAFLMQGLVNALERLKVPSRLALGGWAVLWPLLAALLVFVWLRLLMCRRLGGTTGDTAGALLELLELTVVVTLALLV
ncbi:MAG: adenosylcobinamide-GDP ribazoletransferase, partial [Pseudomonas sp.]|nr:adenosylcobinamide-GDP ribazoletransferase [Pseudomonas sp.]